MSRIENAVAQYVVAVEPLAALDDPSEWLAALERANEAAKEAGACADSATSDELRLAAEKLFPSLEVPDPQPSGQAALTLGVFVEYGLEPGFVGSHLLGPFREVLELTAAFIERVEAELPESADEDVEEEPSSYWVEDRYVTPELAKQFFLEDRRLPQAYFAMEEWCLPVVAVLSRDRNLLAEARGDERLVDLADRLAYCGATFVRMLLMMLSGESLLVLHPSTGQGFKLLIDGVTDNFQLHTLLADALVVERRGLFRRRQGPEWGIPGLRPSPSVAAVARGDGPQCIDEHSSGVWNFYQWTAIDDAAKLPDDVDMEHWIWNEGIPADIAPFAGVRVVILGTPQYTRTWNTARSIAGLTARAEVEEVLDRRQVQDWLTRFASAD